MKTGIKTSELWVTVIAGIITLYAGENDLNLSKEMISALAMLVVTYVGGRSAFKAANQFKANTDQPNKILG
jgi:hypothetical protein